MENETKTILKDSDNTGREVKTTDADQRNGYMNPEKNKLSPGLFKRLWN